MINSLMMIVGVLGLQVAVAEPFATLSPRECSLVSADIDVGCVPADAFKQTKYMKTRKSQAFCRCDDVPIEELGITRIKRLHSVACVVQKNKRGTGTAVLRIYTPREEDDIDSALKAGLYLRCFYE